jgi:hypothetical protein
MDRGPAKKQPEDIWKFVDVRGVDDCWPYKRCKSQGYGMFHTGGHTYKAHRIAYAVAVEPIEFAAPKDRHSPQFVLHHCDNPACCNPSHLYLGNILDNMRDKVERNRCWRGGNNKRPAHV